MLDEFPETVTTDPQLANSLRAFIDRLPHDSGLKIVLCGSAVRTMAALGEERAPLFGRFGLRLQVHPFPLWDFAKLLPEAAPGDIATAYGLFGGTPMYASWWDQHRSVAENISTIMCHPSSRMLTEGELILATEADVGALPRLVLSAIAAGRTRFSHIRDWVGTDPTRTLEQLLTLRLVERIAPVTDSERHGRKVRYRIADPLLSFYLTTLTGHRSAIERGLGASIAPVLVSAVDHAMGRQFEQMACDWVTHRAASGFFGEQIVAVGPWWGADSGPEIDLVGLQGVSRTPAFVGEVKWSRTVDGPRRLRKLQASAAALPGAKMSDVQYLLIGRDQVTDCGPQGDHVVHTFTVDDLIQEPSVVG